MVIFRLFFVIRLGQVDPAAIDENDIRIQLEKHFLVHEHMAPRIGFHPVRQVVGADPGKGNILLFGTFDAVGAPVSDAADIYARFFPLDRLVSPGLQIAFDFVDVRDHRPGALFPVQYFSGNPDGIQHRLVECGKCAIAQDHHGDAKRLLDLIGQGFVHIGDEDNLGRQGKNGFHVRFLVDSRRPPGTASG